MEESLTVSFKSSVELISVHLKIIKAMNNFVAYLTQNIALPRGEFLFGPSLCSFLRFLFHFFIPKI